MKAEKWLAEKYMPDGDEPEMETLPNEITHFCVKRWRCGELSSPEEIETALREIRALVMGK